MDADDYEFDDYDMDIETNQCEIHEIEEESNYTEEEEEREWEEQQETIKNEEMFKVKYGKTPVEMANENQNRMV